MLRWLFLVTVVFMALNVSSATAIASDIQASIVPYDHCEVIKLDNADLDDVALSASANHKFNFDFQQNENLVYLIQLSPNSSQPIRAPPTAC